ncbi:MAG TPA: hypothetical protein VLW85_00135 [Myxococcales bacterium]|nr:hypothetical protein [Myxococcales bacterium]
MGVLFAALLLAAPVPITDIAVGNALTLPAARHMVRLDPQDGRAATWLLALQQDGAGGHWLSWYRSDDEGQAWSYYAPIQDTSVDRDTADAVAVGMDVAMVYSYEGPDIAGSTAHDAYFQWWRWNGNADWVPQAPVKVFDSTSSSTAYLRAEIAIDSQARIWVWAQRLNSDGTFTGVMAVSGDGGATFAKQPDLDSFADRPGGRIMPVGGNRMMLLYSTHGVDPGYMRLRSDGDAVGAWSARQAVFSEGIYHGAALSAAGDGSGGVHLAYKDVDGVLWYRHWDGASWSGRTLIESASDWALQPAITRVDSALVIFWNRVITTGYTYQFYSSVLSGGALSSPKLLDDSGGFKGYPAGVEVLPDTVPLTPCVYGDTADASTGGTLDLVGVPTPNAAPPPPPPPPPPASGQLFADDFNRAAIGPNWQIVSGAWAIYKTRWLASELDTADRVQVDPSLLSCADCSVSAKVVTFGAATATVDLRVQASGDRYDAALLTNGDVEIRRHNGSATTVLGDAASGIADLSSLSTIALQASGAGPVQLVASVNGVAKLSAVDSSSAAITSAGTAGVSTTVAGIAWDDFAVNGAGAGSGGGGSDGGVDAGTPDAGTPDAGTPDAGTPDAGTPDAGAPDGGSGGGGTPLVLFTDDFNRTSLGASWAVVSGAWTEYKGKEAASDLDAVDQLKVVPSQLSCAECTVSAKVVNFGATFAALDLRVQASNDRYDVALLANGHVEIRRHNGSTTAVLGDVATGVAVSAFQTIALQAIGANPVQLTASLNGAPRLSASDSSASAIVGAGTAGLSTNLAGIGFDDFSVIGIGTGSAGGGGASDGGVDAGTPDAGAPDAGTPDAGTPDGGTDGGIRLTVSTTFTSTGFDLLAVDPAGTSYGVDLNSDQTEVWASSDGRNWTPRGAARGFVWMMTALSDGTLLADVDESGTHVISRSTDRGATWTDVLPDPNYRTLTPHSWAELDGAVYFLEYQVFTTQSTPIRLWKSTDGGATWSVKFTFQGHRHGHGLRPDPAHHALFAFFGDFDSQSGLYRSTDGGASWTSIKSGTQAGDIVDGIVLADGSFLCGQDISYQGSIPNFPQIAHLALDGTETDYAQLPSASYSSHAVAGGGFVVGTTHEEGADVEASGHTDGTLWGSGDGVHWQQILTVHQAQPGDDVRADVYWQLPTGELVFNVRNAAGFGPGGRGYLLLMPARQ